MSNLEQRIAEIPELRSIPELKWSHLPGGLCNTNLLIHAGDDRLVLRLNADWPGIDRQREARVLGSLVGSELAPEIIACRPEQGYLLSRFVDLPVWQMQHTVDPERLTDLALCLRRLHEHPFDEPALDLDTELATYLKRPAIRALPEHGAVADNILRLIDELQTAGFDQQRAVLCHNDLMFSNILGPVRPVLIDWEFAGSGHGLIDLAIFIHYHNLDRDQSEPFLVGYFGGVSAIDEELLQLAMRVAQALELLWLVCRADGQELAERPARRLRRLMLVWG